MQQKRQARTLKEAFGPYAEMPSQQESRAFRGTFVAVIAASYAVAAFVLLSEWQATTPPPPAAIAKSYVTQAAR